MIFELIKIIKERSSDENASWALQKNSNAGIIKNHLQLLKTNLPLPSNDCKCFKIDFGLLLDFY
jgi:hypothetical protein